MCRSAVEYPPNGKRCGFGDHFTEAEREARRLKRNARDRELYHQRKTNKTKGTIVSGEAFLSKIDEILEEHKPSEQEKVRSSLINLSNDDVFLSGGARHVHNSDVSTEDSRLIAAKILAGEQNELAYQQITEEDLYFETDSINSVKRLFMEDNTVAYFKSYNAATDNYDIHSEYRHDVLESFNNEVAAYRLCQIMGEGYSDLVPPTVLREYRGNLGTLQAEAAGTVGVDMWGKLRKDYSVEQLKKVALFDFIAGSQDRHLGNFTVIDNGGDGKDKVVLIDNGFAFPGGRDHIPYNTLKLSDIALLQTDIVLDKEERQVIQKVQDSLEQGGGMHEVLSEGQREYMTKRINFLLEEGKLTLGNHLAYMSTFDEIAENDYYDDYENES